MENWAMNENGDPPFGAVNNVQLLWKLHTLQSLGIPVDHHGSSETMEETQDFAPDLTADNNSFVHDDLAQLLSMQDPIKQSDPTGYSFLSDPAASSFPLSSTASPFDLQPVAAANAVASMSTTSTNTSAAGSSGVAAAAAAASVLPGPVSSRKRSRSPSLSHPLDNEPAAARRHIALIDPGITSSTTSPPVPDQPMHHVHQPMQPPPPPQRPRQPLVQQQLPFLPQRLPAPAVKIEPDHHHDTHEPKAARAAVATISPRPCLRLHIQKGEMDPMRHRLDVKGIRRLTLAILRRLGIAMTLEELPEVDVSQHNAADAQHLLPSKAMEVITTMILGTSGDKDVSQTGSSQISNGDLVAVQRMVIAGLRHKGITINTIFPLQILSANAIPAPPKSSSSLAASDQDGRTPYIDLTKVRYELPDQVTRLFLRLYRFILNMLLATPDCWPFVQPVPETAVLYHQEVKHPMDLSTVERKAWQGAYTTFSKFEQDILLIWQNAKSFHKNTGTIPKHADRLDELFRKIVRHLKKQILVNPAQRNGTGTAVAAAAGGAAGSAAPVSAPDKFRFDSLQPLPEETRLSDPLLTRLFSCNSTVYTILTIGPHDDRVRLRGLSNEKMLYLQLNGPFFQAVRLMKEDPTGDHSTLPRFFIAKNRTFLEQVSSHGVLAIFHNVSVKRTQPGQFEVQSDIVIAYPASPLYDIDLLSKVTDEQSPRAYIYLRPLRILENLTFQVNQTVERDYFRRLNTTSKIPPISQGLYYGNEDVDTKIILRRIAHTVLSLPYDARAETGLREQILQMQLQRQQQNDRKKGGGGALGASARKTAAASAKLKRDPAATAAQAARNQMPITMYTVASPTSKRASPVEQHAVATVPESQSPDRPASAATATTIHSPLATASSSSPVPSEPPSPKREIDRDVWRRLFSECRSKGVQVVRITERYKSYSWSVPNSKSVLPNSEGFFKQVYFLEDVVVQKFRGMSMYQRVTEVACLMKLKNLPHMAQLREVLYNDDGDVVGLSLERYEQTLKQYAHAHTHHRLTAHQKYHIILQMIVCMQVIHKAGLAHRDLSEVNFMVSKLDGKLEDGSDKVRVYLIDFGKSVFCRADDVRRWFVDVPRAPDEYKDDVVPESKDELDEWCKNLPWIKAKPDHGYRMYRSIQTLPKTRSHSQVLDWLIEPMAEDMYSIGVMIWKLFSETEPWRGILDTDLQGLRYAAEDDYRIERALERDVSGPTSRELLLKVIRVHPKDRVSAAELQAWYEQDDVRQALLSEWHRYSSETRASRKAKRMYGFEEAADGAGGNRAKRR